MSELAIIFVLAFAAGVAVELLTGVFLRVHSSRDRFGVRPSWWRRR